MKKKPETEQIVLSLRVYPQPLRRILGYIPLIALVAVPLYLAAREGAIVGWFGAALCLFLCGVCAIRMVGIRSEHHGDVAIGVSALAGAVFTAIAFVLAEAALPTVQVALASEPPAAQEPNFEARDMGDTPSFLPASSLDDARDTQANRKEI